ncbi:autotransporter domain-containing protein [Edwardsiella hoshinae]|uniref:beta-glucosidase n=1 Tax=Edwardsiella hoshinae TaxID=93378 RepID=A0A376D9B0_9GAMM|nr:autotransporter domain-containing protein [Edwardsiella hoshinae]QPR28119.1 autotransporter domain-containing protein [Edwardsiella hoshinae]STC84765.1 Periplasmic beta-glucosidase precursor [Edwardsiella hoshinae]
MKNQRSTPFRRTTLARTITLLLAMGTLSPLWATHAQPRLSTRTTPIITLNDSTNAYYFKDANKNGVLDGYEDWRNPIALRVVDLLRQMPNEDKLGLMLIGSQYLGSASNCATANANGILCESYREATSNVFSAPGDSFEFFEKPVIERSAPATEGILDWKVRFMIDRSNADPLTLAIWTNALQQVAESSEFGIPVVVTSNPRNHNTNNVGFGLQESAGTFSLWPSTLGMAAAFIGEMKTRGHTTNLIQDFARLAAQEWDATGIRKMYGYMADTATDPRWFRLADTFGDSPEIVAEATRQIVTGFQGDTLGNHGIAMTSKHFPGGGARDRGTDPHYVYGQYSPYPTKYSLYRYHLPGFIAAVDAGTSSIMPYYARPSDAMSLPQLYLSDIPEAEKSVNNAGDGSTLFTRDRFGNRIYDPLYLAKKRPEKFLENGFSEELGFAYSHKLIDRLLRDQIGFTGYINSDSGILTGMAWGLEAATLAQRVALGAANGVDVFSDLSDVFLFRDAFATEDAFRQGVLDQAAGRLLTEMFRLGLFEDPYRDPQQAVDIFNEPARHEAAYQAHQKSVVVLKNSGNLLPLTEAKIGDSPVYIEFFSRDAEAQRATDTLTLYQAIKRQAPWLNVTFDINNADYALLFVKPADGVGLFEQSAEFVYNLQVNDHNGIDIDRINMIQAKVPTIVNVNLSQPWLLENLEPGAAAITASFATLSEAVVDVLAGNVTPSGALPVTLPRNEGEVVKAETAGPQRDGRKIASDVPGYLRDNLQEYAYTDSDNNRYQTGFHLVWDIANLDNSAPNRNALLQQARIGLISTRYQQAENPPEVNRYYLSAEAMADRVSAHKGETLALSNQVNLAVNQPAHTAADADANLKTRQPARSMNPGLFITKEDNDVTLDHVFNGGVYQRTQDNSANVYSAGIWLDASADHNSLRLNNSINLAYSNALAAYGVFQNASSQDNLLLLQNSLNLSIGDGVTSHGIYHGNSNAYSLLTDEGYDSGQRQAFSQSVVVLDNAANIAVRLKDGVLPSLTKAFTNVPTLILNNSLVGGDITQTAGDDFLLSFNSALYGDIALSNGNDIFVLDESSRDVTLRGQITPDYRFTDSLYIYTPSCNDSSCIQLIQGKDSFRVVSTAPVGGDAHTIADIRYGALNPFNVYQVMADGSVSDVALLSRDVPPPLRPLIQAYRYTFANGYQADFALPVQDSDRVTLRGAEMRVGDWRLTPNAVVTPQGYQLRGDGLLVSAGTPLPALVTGRVEAPSDPTYVLLPDASSTPRLERFTEPRILDPGKPITLTQDVLLVRDIANRAAPENTLLVAIDGAQMQVKTPAGIQASVDINAQRATRVSHIPGSALHVDAFNYLLEVPGMLNDTLQARERSVHLQEGDLDVYLNYLADNRTYDGGNDGAGSKGQTSGIALGLGAGVADALTLYGQLARTYGTLSSGASEADVDVNSLTLALTYRPQTTAESGTPFVSLNAGLGWSQYEPRRQMGNLGQARAESDGWLYSYALTAGYEANLSSAWRLTPSLALQGSYLRQDAFRESGHDTLALDVAQFSDSRNDIALRLDSDYRISLGDWQIAPRLFAEYRYGLGDKNSRADLQLGSATLDPIVHVRGDNQLRGGAELGVGYGTWSLALRADGTVGDKRGGGSAALLVGARF